MKKHLCVLLILIAALLPLLCSAGCVTEEEIPPEMPDTAISAAVLDDFSDSLDLILTDADRRLSAFAHDVIELSDAGTASADELNRIVRSFYIDNIKLTAAGYYDAGTGEYYTSLSEKWPLHLEDFYTSLNFTEHKTLIYGPIVTEKHGTLCAFIHPVYTGGEVTGMVTAIFDPVTLITDAAEAAGGLRGCGALMIDTDGVIFYSAYGSNIGQNIYDFAEEWASMQIYRTIMETPSGITAPFKSHTPSSDTFVWKQGVWKTMPIFDREFRVVILSGEPLPALPADYQPDYPAMESAVKNLYLYISENGKDKAISEMNKADGRFSYENFDLFALDTNGTLLASQKRAYQVGLSCVNWRSAYGSKPVETWADISQTSGGGWYYYPMAISEDPTEPSGMLVCTYLMLIDQSWYIGSQIPTRADTSPVHIDVNNRLEDTMQTVLRMYLDEGAAAFPKYSDRTGTPLEGAEQNIYVLSMEGTVIASSLPAYVPGENLLYLSMPTTGVSTARLLILTAERGGGYLICDFADAEGGDYVASLYIEPLDEDSFVIVSERTGEFVADRKLHVAGGV